VDLVERGSSCVATNSSGWAAFFFSANTPIVFAETAEQGIDPEDAAAVRKFDRNRPGKGSNQDWENPHDPDAKIGPKKDGATDMIYKPEAVVDLDTGAVVQAEVHPGDQADHKEMATRVLEAQQTINEVRGAEVDTMTVQTVTSDKGYYAVSEVQGLQSEAIKTVIADPVQNPRLEKLEPEEQEAVKAARRSVKSKYGKDLLRRRGMHIERSFAHILDSGGMRRATLRGWENLNKRFKLAAAFYNLSQLMRKLCGFGTPKQLEAFGGALFSMVAAVLWSLAQIRAEISRHSVAVTSSIHSLNRSHWEEADAGNFGSFENRASSTDC
jgi:transposase